MTNASSPVSDAFTEWAAIKGIAIRYIQSGKPTQNAFIEQYHRKLVPQALVERALLQVYESRFRPAYGGAVGTIRLIVLPTALGIMCLVYRSTWQ